MDRPYLQLVAHYEQCLARHGDSHLGVDWPRREDAETRYDVMLGVVRADRPGPATLLDLGCGAAHLYEHLLRRGEGRVRYAGLDLSEKFVALCRAKHPAVPFHCGDVLDPGYDPPRADYVVMNGVFTEKRALADGEMFDFFRAMVRRAFALAGTGVAFNVMSKHVDWERADLFHLSTDAVGAFLAREVSRHFVLRHDYGLYEYTAYVYREPVRWPG